MARDVSHGLVKKKIEKFVMFYRRKWKQLRGLQFAQENEQTSKPRIAHLSGGLQKYKEQRGEKHGTRQVTAIIQEEKSRKGFKYKQVSSD